MNYVFVLSGNKESVQKEFGDKASQANKILPNNHTVENGLSVISDIITEVLAHLPDYVQDIQITQKDAGSDRSEKHVEVKINYNNKK